MKRQLSEPNCCHTSPKTSVSLSSLLSDWTELFKSDHFLVGHILIDFKVNSLH